MLLIGVFLGVFGLWLWDGLLIGLSLAVFLFTGYRYLRFHEAQGVEIVVSPMTLELSVVAGDSVSEAIEVDSPGAYELVSELNGLSYEPFLIGSNENVVELIYSPVLGSVKTLKSIMFRAVEPYGLFTSDRTVPVDYNLVSYPRVYPVAARALAALAEMGTMGSGSVPTNLRGDGTEYAETRDYQPGDPLRRFDWKAYARTNKPMVKDYYLEGGGGTSITYDNQADNPVSLDELNSAFLQLVLSVTQGMTQTQIIMLREDEVYELDRFNTLLKATQIALQGQVTEFMRYYTLLDPLAHRRSFTNKALGKKIQSTPQSREYNSKVILSSLSGNPSNLLRFLENMNSQDTSLLVPTKPWIHQTSLEKSQKSYTEHLKMIERLEKKGYRVYTTPNEVLSVQVRNFA